jgi:GntR family transcriptional regulator
MTGALAYAAAGRGMSMGVSAGRTARRRSGETSTGVADLAAAIRRVVAGGDLRPGDRVPTEAELTQAVGASRPMVREALRLLEQDGLLRVVHGRGRFLRAAAAIRVERPITCFESVTEMVRGFGYEPASRVLSVAEIPADAEASTTLRLSAGEPVVRLERLRLRRREVILYSLDIVPRRALPARLHEIDWSGSLVALLSGFGQAPVMSSATASAVSLPDDVQSRYDLADFGPAFLIVETCFTEAGAPVILARDYHRGSSFSFNFLRK